MPASLSLLYLMTFISISEMKIWFPSQKRRLLFSPGMQVSFPSQKKEALVRLGTMLVQVANSRLLHPILDFYLPHVQQSGPWLFSRKQPPHLHFLDKVTQPFHGLLQHLVLTCDRMSQLLRRIRSSLQDNPSSISIVCMILKSIDLQGLNWLPVSSSEIGISAENHYKYLHDQSSYKRQIQH